MVPPGPVSSGSGIGRRELGPQIGESGGDTDMEKHPQVERQWEGETEIEKNTVKERHRLQREWRWRKETRET